MNWIVKKKVYIKKSKKIDRLDRKCYSEKKIKNRRRWGEGLEGETRHERTNDQNAVKTDDSKNSITHIRYV